MILTGGSRNRLAAGDAVRTRSSSYSGFDDAASDTWGRLTASSGTSPQGLDWRTLQSQILGGVTLTPVEFLQLIDLYAPSVIVELFTRLTCPRSFFTDYHPRLPFLASKRLVLEECQTCPLLYWSIASIASQASPAHAQLRTRLVWPIRRLAAEASLSLPSLPIIQALVLLCAWPLPFAALLDDPCWTWIGIAIQKGLQMGLHGTRASVASRNHADEETTRAMQATWLTSNVLHHLYVNHISHNAD